MTPVKETQRRAEKLLDTPLRVFYHPSFDDPRQRKRILADMPGHEKFQQDIEKVRRLRNNNIAPEMRPCYEAPLLDVAQEKHLFRQMNYFKYRAKKLMAKLQPRRAGRKTLDRIDAYLAKAAALRNQIAESNFRLATQILKGHITFYREHTLTEALLSDAYFDVLKAVDYFNWTLGNRFSTYATWVVKKNFFRDSKQQARNAERVGHLDETSAEILESRSDGLQEEKEYQSKRRVVKRLLRLLEDGSPNTDRKRQVFVLENYFGINGHERNTLENISEKIGVTKERVRQLKEKGLAWIKEKVEELGIRYETELEDDTGEDY